MNNIIVGVLCVFIYILIGMGMLGMYILFHYQNKPKLYKRLLVITFWPLIYIYYIPQTFKDMFNSLFGDLIHKDKNKV